MIYDMITIAKSTNRHGNPMAVFSMPVGGVKSLHLSIPNNGTGSHTFFRKSFHPNSLTHKIRNPAKTTHRLSRCRNEQSTNQSQRTAYTSNKKPEQSPKRQSLHPQNQRYNRSPALQRRRQPDHPHCQRLQLHA